MRNVLFTSGLALFAMLAAGYAVAADPTETRDPAAQPAAGQPANVQAGAQNMFMDHLVASGLQRMSQGEVELANFALKRTQNDDVRKFAQMMIKDHEDFDKQLEKFAGSASETGATNQPNREAANRNASDTAGGAAAQNAHANLLNLQKEFADNCISAVEKQLGQFQGPDFDRAYLGQQFWVHVIFVANAQTAEKHVSGDLKNVVNNGAQTAEKHLQECQRLIASLSSNIARNPAGATETPPRR